MVDFERDLYHSKRSRGLWLIAAVPAVIIMVLVGWYLVQPDSVKDFIGRTLAPEKPRLYSIVVVWKNRTHVLTPGDKLTVGLGDRLQIVEVDTNVPFNHEVRLIGVINGRKFDAEKLKAGAIPKLLFGAAPFQSDQPAKITVMRKGRIMGSVYLALTIKAKDLVGQALATSDPAKRVELLKTARKLKPGDDRITLALADGLAAIGKGTEAGVLYNYLLAKARSPKIRAQLLGRLVNLSPKHRGRLTALADQYVQNGQIDLAIKTYRRVPGWSRSRHILTRLAALLKKRPKQWKLYYRVIGYWSRADRKNVPLLRLHIALLERTGGRGLKGALTRMAGLRPNKLSNLRKLSRILLRQKAYKTLRPYQEKIVKLAPADKRALKRLVWLYRRLGMNQKARRAELKLAKGLPPDRAIAIYLALAQKAKKQNRPDEVTRLLAQALARDPYRIDLRKRLAAHLLSIKKYRAAAPHVAFLAERAPGKRKLALTLVRVYELAGDLRAAGRALERWTAGHPKDKQAVLHLLYLYQKAGNQSGQVRVYRQLLQGDPQNPAYLQNLALIHQKRREWSDAAGLLKKIIALKPKSRDAHQALFNVLKASGRMTEAALQAKKILKLDPGRLDLYAFLFNHLMGQNRAGELVPILKKAIKRHRGNVKLIKALAAVYIRLDDDKRAVATLKRAVRLTPKNTKTLHLLAAVYDKMGRIKEAIRTYDRILRIDPEDEKAQDSRLRLRRKEIKKPRRRTSRNGRNG